MSKSAFESFYYSIKWRVILNVVLLHAILMVLVVVDNISRQKEFITEELKSESVNLTKALALNAPTWLLINDLTALDELIIGYRSIENISNAMILDNSGKIRASIDRELFNKVLSDQISMTLIECAKKADKECLVLHHNLSDAIYPIKSENNTIGYARVILDTTAINKEINKSIWLGFLYVFVAVVIGGVIAWFTIKSVTAKLNRLSVAADMVSGGNFDIELKDDNGKDEASKLIRAFLFMFKRVKEKMGEKEKMMMQQSKMAAMGDMIGAIAHQLKQPLNVMSVIKDNIMDEAEYDELTKGNVKEYMAAMSKQIKYMATTIDDFKVFFKPDKKEDVFGIKDSIQDVYDLISYQLKNHNVIFSLHGDDFSIKAYKNEFKQAILNIFNNSKDAIFERISKNEITEGKIEVLLSRTDEDIGEITIRDNGGGIKDENVAKLFEPYFTTKGEKGTGIGLYLVKQIVAEKLKGKISMQSIENGLETKIELKIDNG